MIKSLPSILFVSVIAILAAASIVLHLVDAVANPPRIYFETLGMKMQLQALPVSANPSFTQDMFEIVFEASDNGGYLSIGWSYGVMTGRLLGCVYPSAGATTGSCTEMAGDGYNAPTTASTHTIISANNSGGVAIVVVRIPAASFGVSESQGMRRVIFARGPNGKGGKGGEFENHEDQWSQLGVDIFKGTHEIYGQTKWTFLTLFLAWLVSLLTALVGAALKQFHERSGRTVTWTLQVLAWLVFGGCFAAVFVESHAEFSKRWAPAPAARALGSCCAYIFSLIMFPTTRYLNVGYLAGSSFDRFINFHVIGGIILFVLVLAHAIWFIAVSLSPEGGASASIIGNFGKDETIPVLPAVFGLILFIAFFVIALLRAKISFYWFKISHFCFPVIVLLFSIHYPVTAICIAPGLILWVVDVILRYTRTSNADPRISHVEVEQVSRVVKMTVTLKGAEKTRWAQGHPGQYAFFNLTTVSELCHPFTFIHRSRDGSEITFMIRAAGHFTEHLYLTAKTYPASLIDQPSLIRIFAGPVGILEVDHRYPTDIVYVSGGIGVTAMQGLLFDLVEKFEDAKAEPSDDSLRPRAQSVNFVWSVREVELLRMVFPYVTECCQRLEAVAPELKFMAKIFVTGAKDPSVLPQNSNPKIMLVAGKRPSGDVDMAPLENSVDGVAAYYSCGPVPLMKQARDAASSRGALIHEEVFDF